MRNGSKKAAESPKKLGRPSMLNDMTKALILRMYKNHLKDDTIAEIIGISDTTLDNWKKSDASFLGSIKDMKEMADEAIESSLLHRAMGYSCKATKVFLDQRSGRTIEHEYIEHYPPDPTSMIFWLKNRQPKKWRDKQETEITGEGIVIKIDKDDAAL